MPDHGVGTVTGIDAQLALPGVILEVQFTLVLEHPLATAIDPQFAFLLANLAIQLVIALGAFQPRQRYLANVTNTPIGVQRMAQLTGFAVLVLGAQAQFHGFTEASMQVDLPVAQLQAPMQADSFVIGTALQQLPVDQPGPAMGGPGIFTRVPAIPGPAYGDATANRADLRPLRRAPQPGFLSPWLEMQQLRTLATEHRLAQWMVDHQHFALLKALPLEDRLFAPRFEKAL